MGWVVNATPGCFLSVVTRYPLYRGLGGPLGRSVWVWKISPPPPPDFDLRTVQPVPSRYINYAIPAHLHWQNRDYLLEGVAGVGGFLD